MHLLCVFLHIFFVIWADGVPNDCHIVWAARLNVTSRLRDSDTVPWARYTMYTVEPEGFTVLPTSEMWLDFPKKLLSPKGDCELILTPGKIYDLRGTTNFKNIFANFCEQHNSTRRPPNEKENTLFSLDELNALRGSPMEQYLEETKEFNKRYQQACPF